MDAAKQGQIFELERGGNEPPEEQLIDRASIKAALPLVSKAYFEQTLLAEYPDLKFYFEALDGQKATQRLATLANLWGLSEDKAAEIARRLHEVGFFEKLGVKSPEYRIPFLLRPALNVVQGQASEDNT